MKKEKEFALYKGDEYIMIGKIDEIAKYLNISIKSALDYATPYRRARSKTYFVVRLD